MKNKMTFLGVLLAFFALLANARAQFSSGSDGSYGALNPSGSTTIQLPPSGILNCTTVNIPSGCSLHFAKNALNTPVYILATGDVAITGQIYVDGSSGLNTGLAGDSGPGGFAGGPGATASGDAAGPGQGPGGGKAGTATTDAAGAGGGSYATVNPYGAPGTAYGSRLLIPLIGGSGGGGTSTPYSGNGSYYGGGGGGGAILIASSTKIIFSGSSSYISAGGGGAVYNGGSGGAIRLVAPTITGSSQNGLNVSGSNSGIGRTRLDTLDHSTLSIPGVQSIGNVMVVFPTPLPKLSVVNAAGTAIADGTGNPVTVFLPSGSSSSQQITVRARDFGGIVPIRIALVPETGSTTYTDATIDNTTNNPADGAVTVNLPVNVQVHVEVYTR